MISVCMSNQAQVYRGIVAFAKENNSDLPRKQVLNHGEWVTMYNKTTPSGLGRLVHFNLIDPQVLYCPMWDHPAARYNVKIGSKGGFHSNRDDDPDLIWTSTAFRHYPDLGNSTRSANLMKDENTLAIMADHWTKRADNDFGWDQGNGAFGHMEGVNYVTSYIDGSNKLVYDKSRAIIKLSIGHTSRGSIESTWEQYFDKE